MKYDDNKLGYGGNGNPTSMKEDPMGGGSLPEDGSGIIPVGENAFENAPNMGERQEIMIEGHHGTSAQLSVNDVVQDEDMRSDLAHAFRNTMDGIQKRVDIHLKKMPTQGTRE